MEKRRQWRQWHYGTILTAPLGVVVVVARRYHHPHPPNQLIEEKKAMSYAVIPPFGMILLPPAVLLPFPCLLFLQPSCICAAIHQRASHPSQQRSRWKGGMREWQRRLATTHAIPSRSYKYKINLGYALSVAREGRRKRLQSASPVVVVGGGGGGWESLKRPLRGPVLCLLN